MSSTYRVGKMTDFGILLAEAVKIGHPDETISLYQYPVIPGYSVRPAFTLRHWLDEDGQGRECQTDSYETDNQEEAYQLFVEWAFGISV